MQYYLGQATCIHVCVFKFVLGYEYCTLSQSYGILKWCTHNTITNSRDTCTCDTTTMHFHNRNFFFNTLQFKFLIHIIADHASKIYIIFPNELYSTSCMNFHSAKWYIFKVKKKLFHDNDSSQVQRFKHYM